MYHLFKICPILPSVPRSDLLGRALLRSALLLQALVTKTTFVQLIPGLHVVLHRLLELLLALGLLGLFGLLGLQIDVA